MQASSIVEDRFFRNLELRRYFSWVVAKKKRRLGDLGDSIINCLPPFPLILDVRIQVFSPKDSIVDEHHPQVILNRDVRSTFDKTFLLRTRSFWRSGVSKSDAESALSWMTFASIATSGRWEISYCYYMHHLSKLTFNFFLDGRQDPPQLTASPLYVSLAARISLGVSHMLVVIDRCTKIFKCIFILLREVWREP